MHYERVSLARRGGSWRMSYRAVYDAERKGDRKWATIGAAASRAEAEHLAAEYLYNLPRDPEDERRAEAIEATEGRMPTVGELRRDDIDHALAVGAIEKSTHAGYCRHVRLLGDLGEIPVDRVTAQDVQLYVDSLVEDGYCPETVNHMLWTVRDTLELASFRMLRPPLDLRRIRAPKHDRPLPRALSAEEKNALLAALPCIRGPLDAIVRLALFAGLRCGEICALRWANVDLNRRMVRITSAIGTLPSSNGYLKGPKSPAGVRALPIADGLMEGLERRRAEQEARCRDAGVPFTDDIFVVGDIDGAFMVPRYANQLFRTFVRTFGIGGGKCGLHRLRHTFATELIMSGVNPKTVSNWLGHTDPSFTLRIYVSSSPENLRASVDTVNEVMALPEGYDGQGSELPARIRGQEKKEPEEEPLPDAEVMRTVKIISWESLACG